MVDSMDIDGTRISYIVQEPGNANGIFSMQNPMPWDDDSGAKFVCSLCHKTFYNAVALQNHKNMQHDGQCSGSDAEFQSATGQLNSQSMSYDYKFYPLKKPYDPSEMTIQKDGITTRTYSEDTTFLIVKVEGVSIDDKRRRLEGVVKRARMKPAKQTVDLRGPFTCTLPSTLRPDMQCHQVFFNCCQYSLHYREEHTKRRKAALRCQICEKRLDEDFYLGLRAPSRATFSCRLCNMTFHDSLDYDEHNSSVHAKVKPHQCSLCAKRFTQQGGLQQHMRMHSGVRPFACTYCPKAFTQRAGLDQHLRIHTKIKPFKCVICHKCFSQSVHLRQHMRTHTNIQPFECSVCGRRFKQTSHLNFHMRSHANECQAGVMEKLEQLALHGQASPLSLARLQPVRDGDTLYYAAELATPDSHYYQQVAESGNYLHA
ncbi:zinc finger protein 454-like [Cydia fagiglandana]|uniref:zinc finger protein 454-like n=1 Tax=Cydia fagiglandana TaxID=1458189 RepID=UPI002FEDEEAB